jgi:maltose/moltooligosaccharide transporter
MLKYKLPKNQVLLSFSSFAIQYATTIIMVNISSLYIMAGSAEKNLSYLWLAGPVAGLIGQLIIGYTSDIIQLKLKSRKPDFALFSLLSCLVTFNLPFAHSEAMISMLFWQFFFYINGCIIILRAWVTDITPKEYQPTAFALQTIFAGAGSFLAGFTPWLITLLPRRFDTWNNNLPLTMIGSFMISIIILLLGTMWPILFAKSVKAKKKIKTVPNLIKILNPKEVPGPIKKLFPMQIFVWLGIFLIWAYLPLFLSQHIYGLPLDIKIADHINFKQQIAKGSDLAGKCMGIYQLASTFFSFLIPALVKSYNKKYLLGVTVALGGIGFIACVYTDHVALIMLNMVAVGIMFGSLSIIPTLFVVENISSDRIGIYLGIFNLTITFPQIIGGLLVGPTIAWAFNNNASHYILISGILIMIGGLINLRKDDLY